MMRKKTDLLLRQNNFGIQLEFRHWTISQISGVHFKVMILMSLKKNKTKVSVANVLNVHHTIFGEKRENYRKLNTNYSVSLNP